MVKEEEKIEDKDEHASARSNQTRYIAVKPNGSVSKTMAWKHIINRIDPQHQDNKSPYTGTDTYAI